MNTMAMYLIGDIQGCDEPLQRLLAELAFSPSRDTLFLLGDLVNRGPASASVLRRLMGYGAAAQCVLGNHDLHLLALAQGARAPHRSDTVNDILQAPDRSAMLDWLRWQRLAILEHIDGLPVLMVHAGVLPSWTVAQTMARAAEVEQVLCSDTASDFLRQLYGDEPSAWREGLQGVPRWRMIVNALTRLRFCDAAKGQLGRGPHPRAHGAVRQRAIPCQGSLFQHDEAQPEHVHERAHGTGFHHLPVRQPEPN